LVVLGRLLGPEPYGLIAMALIVIAFGELFVIDSGFGDAIIQRKELSDDHCDAAFWLLLGSSLIAMTIFMLGSPLVAASFDQPRVAGLISALSLTLPLGALSAVPNALLSRELRFRALAARGLISGTGGGTAAIGMALAGWGVWSLVGFHLVQRTLAVVVVWTAHRWRPRFSFSLVRARALELQHGDVWHPDAPIRPDGHDARPAWLLLWSRGARLLLYGPARDAPDA
jgi:O-antigen/teichoic acid export membrane protein